MKKGQETPLMKQYYAIKAKHPDAMLLFRVGDFYETFGEDAVKASDILGITLTKRANGKASEVALAGFPHHALETYLPKLVRSGMRVAVCDQLEDPKKTKKIVKRGVTELVTPGTTTSDNLLENKQNNFLASISYTGDNLGLALLDLSTGEFFITEGHKDYVDSVLRSLNPSELLYPKSKQNEFQGDFGESHYSFRLEDWLCEYDFGKDKLLNHFQTKNLKGFGVEKLKNGIAAAGAILYYLEENKHHNLSHISTINRLDRDEYVWLDNFTIRNLELIKSTHEEGIPLFQILDATKSPMGARMLKKWLVLPLRDITAINKRQEIVQELFQKQELREALRKLIASIGDLDWLISRAAMKRINPRELLQIHNALIKGNEIKELLGKEEGDTFQTYVDQINPCEHIKKKIGATIIEEPPIATNKGNLIKEGINKELDELKSIATSGKEYLLEMQKRETEATGIPSLKIGFNNVFGYYLEVRNTHKSKVPENWIRKQTLVSAERYITDELKTYEEKILGAEDKISEIEQEIYNKLIIELLEYVRPIQQNALSISKLDALQSLAEVAEENEYCKPKLSDTFAINIKAGRHPVIEKTLPPGESYIPNDILLDNETQQIIILTGPNMSGKSALLRQTALITLLAQIGSFVPAEEADIGIVDKIFTRVGAMDNISSGDSTFMVEMTETASILNNVSTRSLILLDEIGRGTSTYDGVSIAWAICEFLHKSKLQPKTLFATHYHELNELADSFNRIRNFHVSVKEYQGKVIFMRKLQSGGSEHSFGINVAQMAGIPEEVVKRAKTILHTLESSRENINSSGKKKIPAQPDMQMSLFSMDDPTLKKIREELERVEINSLTPVEALMKLNELKKMMDK